MSLENPSRSARKLDCQKPQCGEGPSGVNPNVPSSRIQLEVHPVPRALMAMAMLGWAVVKAGLLRETPAPRMENSQDRIPGWAWPES